MMYAHKYRGFTMVELAVIILIAVLLPAVLLPVLHQARHSARIAGCETQARAIAQGCQLYAVSNNGRLPAVSYSELYGDYHSIGRVWQPGGRTQRLLPDLLSGAAGISRDYWMCPTSGRAVEFRQEKCIAAGSYDYMCGHQHGEVVDEDSPPPRLWLAFYGPNGIKRGGPGSDAHNIDAFLPCGNNVDSTVEPVSLILCNGWGHHGPLAGSANWEKEFFPSAFGGSGSEVEGETVVAYTDGSARSPVASFEKWIEALGLDRPRIEALATEIPMD